jgi:hypothetical protein
MNLHKKNIYLIGVFLSVFYDTIHTSMPPELFEENIDYSTYLPQPQPTGTPGQVSPSLQPSSPLQPNEPSEVSTTQWEEEIEEPESEATITGTYDRQNWYKNLRYFREARTL